MAALIASPKKHITQNVMYTYGKTENTFSGFFVLCLISVCFSTMHLENTKRGENNPKQGKTKQKKGQMQNRRTGAYSLCGMDPGPLIHNSQFKTVQIDTDYHHMICLGFAPVFFLLLFCLVFLYFFSHPTLSPMAYMTWW